MVNPIYGNYGIVIGGQANLHGVAIAAGKGAKAVNSGTPSSALEELKELLAELRVLLQRQLAADGVTPEQSRAANTAIEGVQKELTLASSGGFQVLAVRVTELAACLTGIDVLAEIAGRLYSLLPGITG
jgi:hypothetical protein